MRSLATLLFALAATAMTAVPAQDLPIRVGRIAHIDGSVSLYQDPEEGWDRAYVNSPITSENSIWTDDDARAEVRISGMALRLDQLTQLDIARLDETAIDAFVARGTLALRVRHFENNERLVFNTPNARVRVRANGRYRIDVDPDRVETRVTVFAGEVRIGTDDGRMRVGAGRSVLIFGDPPEFFEERAGSDAFDRWSLARDERWREGRAPTYVSTYMTGYEDLDAYGSWATEPDYGVLWYPRGVAANWAPYRHGRWDYVRPWGWTWIDDSPWGYAPFHYGRWVYVRDRWAWHPGERVARPAWAPALVAWVGGSSFNVGVSTGGPAVGWYPLSPWDRYDPWFQASPTYVNRVNIVVRRDQPTRADRRQWREWTRERGTTVVDRKTFVDRRPVATAALPVTMEAIRQARAVQRPESVLPSRADVQQSRRAQPQPAPTAPAVAQPGRQPAQPGQAAQQPPGRSAVARPDFGRRASVETPRRATTPPPTATAPSAAPPGRGPTAMQAQERAQREAQQQAEREAREAQQQQKRIGREAQQAQERAQREAQQQAEREAREAQQQQKHIGREAQERAQREAQQQAERAAKEAQQAQQRAQQQQQSQERAQQQAQERAQREAQQAQERAAKEAQRAQQQQAQERAQREAQQAERAAKEAQRAQQQQEQQRQAQERAQQQAQERAQREAQQQAERAAKEAQRAQQQQAQQQAQQQQAQQQQAQARAQREAQQAQQAEERAQREAQQAQERAAKSAQPKGRDKDDDDDKEKGKGKGRDR